MQAVEEEVLVEMSDLWVVRVRLVVAMVVRHQVVPVVMPLQILVVAEGQLALGLTLVVLVARV
jgi:hypothetical protein